MNSKRIIIIGHPAAGMAFAEHMDRGIDIVCIDDAKIGTGFLENAEICRGFIENDAAREVQFDIVEHMPDLMQKDVCSKKNVEPWYAQFDKKRKR